MRSWGTAFQIFPLKFVTTGNPTDIVIDLEFTRGRPLALLAWYWFKGGVLQLEPNTSSESGPYA